MTPGRDESRMALWEVSPRTQYDYPFIEMSGKHPGIPISMWCVWNRELVQVPAKGDAALKDIEREIRKAGRVVDRWIEAGETRVFMLRCTCADHDSPWNIWEPHEFKECPPAGSRGGWGYFRLLTFDDSSTKDLFRDFSKRGPTELLGKKELALQVLPTSMWVNSLFADLTGKQIDALGGSRSPYEEHLRKAENRVVEALMPYLQLFAAGEKDLTKMPSKGPVDAAPPGVWGSP